MRLHVEVQGHDCELTHNVLELVFEFTFTLSFIISIVSFICNDNVYFPESQLRKKSQSIAYHFVREGVARDEWRTAYVNTHDNTADLLTKPLPDGEKRRKFVNRLVYHVYQQIVG